MRSAPATFILALALLTITVPLVPSTSANHPAGTTCEAWFISPQNGQVTAQTQVLSTSVDTGSALQGVMVSTTGQIDVEIGHICLRFLSFQVREVAPDGSETLIHQNKWDIPCGDAVEQTETDTVEIGLDAGEYVFELSWTDCHRETGGEGEHGWVTDPPLPLEGLARLSSTA